MAKVVFIDTDYKYGYHISKFPTFLETFKSFEDIQIPFNCFQIYIANSRGFSLAKFELNDLLQTNKFLKEREWYLCIHGSLLYNFCGAIDHKKNSKFDYLIGKYCSGLTRELDVGAGLGAGVVIHPGSCKEKEKGLETIGKCMVYCLTCETPEIKALAKAKKIKVKEALKLRKVILENAAGEGTKLAVTLEEISKILSYIPKHLHDQVKVCIDTAHAFGAGLYKWGDPKEVKRFYSDFEKIIGLEYLEVFHLNDSRRSEKKSQNAPFGSRKDRHENLGLGYIFEGEGNEGLKEFFAQAKKRKIPIIGEPPGKTEDGNEGPRSVRDWDYVVELLKDEEYPLEF